MNTAEVIANHAGISRLQASQWAFTEANTKYLTHSLHPYPAKFIPQIPRVLIQELSCAGETVADIFCGSGTTLVEALQLNRHAIGIDANPLAALISRAKTTWLSDFDVACLRKHQCACADILEYTATASFTSEGWRPAQEVTSFWFLPHVVEELAELRLRIDEVASETAKTLCKVAFSAIIVKVSKQDSDSRYVRREKILSPGAVIRQYLNQVSSATKAAHEMSKTTTTDATCHVLNSNVLEAPNTGQFDLVVTSPPYPNAYSYHLYHRTRLLWLGYDPDTFKHQEIGSHRKYSAKGPQRATPGTFRQEFGTIFRWLRDKLRDQRHVCFVIGDSKIQGKRIDNASILSEIGRECGFREVARIERTIPRQRKSLNPKIGRIHSENILILQKA